MKLFPSQQLRKLLPFQKQTAKKPVHAGEIYYLWEGLTSGYKLITMAEMYLMNTEDTELQMYLKALTTGTFLIQIRKLEDVLRDQGFTVPPRPATKLLQGSPGAGQEVKLTDKEIIRNLSALGQVFVLFNARSIMACTDDTIRGLFQSLMAVHLKSYKLFVALGKKRNVFDPPPPATARKNSLNMYEVGVTWDQLTARHVSQVNMETLLASTMDQDIISLLKWGLNEIVMPEMAKLEDVLKNEGITIPPRPTIRQYQYSQGQINKIRSSDEETLGILTLATQASIIVHVRSLMVAVRGDIFDLFESFLYKEFEGYDKTIALAKKRRILDNPPVVSSMRI